MNSKELFHRLIQALTLEEREAEKEAVIFYVLEYELKLSKAGVMTGKEVSIDDAHFDKIIRRLNLHEPVQYVLGEAEFYGRKFFVNRSVLIPRPETELLVKSVITQFRSHQKITLLDIGTGSGCIAITLALELPSATVLATDIRNEALSVASQNAKELGANVQFHRHDILKEKLPFKGLEAVVSNPPYILENEKKKMARNVIDYEPAEGLFVPDSDPLLYHTAIAEKAKLALTPGGFLIAEINEQMGRDASALLNSNGFNEVTIIKDLDGKDRFVSGTSSGS